MFGNKSRSVRQATPKTSMNTKMIEETPVRDHIICMIVLLNKIKILEVEINGEI